MGKNNKLLNALPLFLAPFFKPVGIKDMVILNSFFVAWKFIAIAIIVLCCIWRKEKIHVNRSYGFWGLCSFWGIYISHAFVNGYFDSDILINAVISIFLLVLARELVLRGYFYQYVDALSKVFKTWFWIFVITFPLVRNGISLFGVIDGDYIYFLGTDNYSAFFLVPMIGVILINSSLRGDERRLKRDIVCYVGVFCVLYTIARSMTALMSGMVVLGLFLIFRYRMAIMKLLSVKNVLLFSALLLVLIIEFDIQDIFAAFLTNVIGKGVTLNSRTIIWDSSLDLISKRPLLGYGALSDAFYDTYALYGASHAHNMILELLLRTGVIGTICYMGFILAPLKKMMRNVSGKTCFITYVFLVGQLFLFLMDFYPTIQTFYCYMSVVYGLALVKVGNKRYES